jgi:hypothetical protein
MADCLRQADGTYTTTIAFLSNAHVPFCEREKRPPLAEIKPTVMAMTFQNDWNFITLVPAAKRPVQPHLTAVAIWFN